MWNRPFCKKLYVFSWVCSSQMYTPEMSHPVAWLSTGTSCPPSQRLFRLSGLSTFSCTLRLLPDIHFSPSCMSLIFSCVYRVSRFAFRAQSPESALCLKLVPHTGSAAASRTSSICALHLTPMCSLLRNLGFHYTVAISKPTSSMH